MFFSLSSNFHAKRQTKKGWANHLIFCVMSLTRRTFDDFCSQATYHFKKIVLTIGGQIDGQISRFGRRRLCRSDFTQENLSIEDCLLILMKFPFLDLNKLQRSMEPLPSWLKT